MKGGEIMHKEIKPTRIACFFVAIIMICSTLFSAIPTYANTESDFDSQDSIAVYSNSATSTCSISVSGITATCTVRVKSPNHSWLKSPWKCKRKNRRDIKPLKHGAVQKPAQVCIFPKKGT